MCFFKGCCPHWMGLWIIWFWVLGSAKLQAQTSDITLPKLTEPTIFSIQEIENVGLPDKSYLENPLIPLDDQLLIQPILSAAPENFNPDLRFIPPLPPPASEPAQPSPEDTPQEPEQPWLTIENLQVDFRNDQDNFGQHNLVIEPTAQFRLPNGQLLRFKSGFNTYERKNFETITNIPLQIGWQGKIGKYTLQGSAGLDLFNRVPPIPNFRAEVNAPIFSNLTAQNQLESGLFLSGIFEQGAYKFNAQTIENQITAFRFGSNIFWQINSKTSFFSLYRFGFYNDGNYEQQSFSRLERKIGSFFVAANVFSWGFKEDLSQTSGYFSPPNFLVYNGEIGWEGDVAQFLRCRAFGNFGQQRLKQEFNIAYSYQTRCTVKMSSNLELDLGYAFSNVRNQTGDSAYNNHSITGQIRVKF